MMYAQFDFVRPSSLNELTGLLKNRKEGTLIYAGGTDLLVFLRAKKVSAQLLIDVKDVPEFQGIREQDDCISIGSAVTMTQIQTDPLVLRWAPALAKGVGEVGSVPIRNKATLAGNIQTASPAADGLNALWGLDGVLVLVSEGGERRVPVQEYVLAPRKTVIRPDEVIARIEVPKTEWTKQVFFKVGRRNALAISVVNGIVALKMAENGTIADARVSVGAVAPTPLRIGAAEAKLVGRSLNADLIEEVGAIVQENVKPISDLRATKEYRRYIAGVMVKKQLRQMMDG